jgi:hypothetical protein
MPADAYEYALIRVVPRVERGEFVNVGAVLLCRQQRFLETRLEPNEALLRALAPELDLEAVAELLALIPVVCRGGRGSGPIGELPIQERFRWLTAPRSTVIQPSPVHIGLCDDPSAALARIMAQLVG